MLSEAKEVTLRAVFLPMPGLSDDPGNCNGPRNRYFRVMR